MSVKNVTVQQTLRKARDRAQRTMNRAADKMERAYSGPGKIYNNLRKSYYRAWTARDKAQRLYYVAYNRHKA